MTLARSLEDDVAFLRQQLNALQNERYSLRELAEGKVQITSFEYHYHPPDYRGPQAARAITTAVTIMNSADKTMCVTLQYIIT